ncbi:MAG: thiamine pyrophosphate-binding protein, partial [bacterium]|nr:thiamine pyrophosphate-binding protein [bacterium]
IAEVISAQQAAAALRERDGFHAEIAAGKARWEAMLAQRRDSSEAPFTAQRPLAALRTVLDRSGIIVAGSGNTQGAVKQSFPVYEPRTHLTSGSFSPMGWAFPAALGAKLAQPDRPVVAVVGDGDVMMSLPEMGTAVMNDIPVVIMVQNNQGYMSIRGGQRKFMGRHIASEFNHHKRDGEPYSADLSEVAKAFGVEAWKVKESSQLEPALEAA